MQFKYLNANSSMGPDRQVLFAGVIPPMDCLVLPPGWLFCESLGSEQCLGMKVSFLHKATTGELSKLLMYAGFASKKPDVNLALLSQATVNC